MPSPCELDLGQGMEDGTLKPLAGPRIEPRGQTPQSLVVLLHGYGANGDDLIELGRAWARDLPSTAFVAPHAPDHLPYDDASGLQWFPLTFRDPDEYWRGAKAAGPQLDAFLDAELTRYRLPASRLALVGFSQGTMMTLHVGLRRSAAPAALVGYSGMIAGPEHLKDSITCRPPVLLIHGSDDEVIPAGALHLTREALADAEVPVEWHIREGLGHGIDPEGLAMGGSFLKAALK